MRSHCALYVDAGYLLASAATRLTGTSLRGGVTVDHSRLIEALIRQAEDVSGLPLLRVNWYDAAANGVPDPAQERIGLLPRVKIRLGRVGFNGEQKGVDLRIGLDMVAHARNGAVDVVLLVSGDDDLTEAVEEAQVHGVRVVILAVPNNAGLPHAVSKHLQRAADGLELVDTAAVDETVRPRARAVIQPAEPAVPIAVPTPAHLANHRRTSAAPVPAPPAAPKTDSGIVYSAETGTVPKISPQYSRTPEELAEISDNVAKRVLDTWLRSATAEQRAELLAGRPSIPRDADRALLLDLSEALGDYDLSDPVRYQLRASFWAQVDAEPGLVASPPG